MNADFRFLYFGILQKIKKFLLALTEAAKRARTLAPLKLKLKLGF